MTSSIVFFDSRIDNYLALAADIAGEHEWVLLDPLSDGVDQITAYLYGRTGIGAIHLVSHGSAGSLYLGSTSLNGQNLADHAGALQAIGQSLTPSGDLLLYGCDVAAGPAGSALLEQLAAMTGADLAASTDVTGAAALGGNAILEASVGEVEAPALFTQAALDQAQTLLGASPASITPSSATFMTQMSPSANWNQSGDINLASVSMTSTKIDKYGFIPDVDGYYVISTGLNVDTALAIYNSAGAQIANVDDYVGSETLPSQYLYAGTWYYVAVTGFATGTYSLSINGPDLIRSPLPTPAPTYASSSGSGTLTLGDRDIWQITAPAGVTTLNLSVAPALNIDVMWQLMNSAGAVIASRDLAGTGGTETQNAIAVTVGTTYYVGVNSYSADSVGGYLLTADFNPDQQPPNQAPVNAVPGAQTATEDTAKVISGISVSDADAGAFSVTMTLTQTHGTIAVNTAVGGGVAAGSISGNNSGTITLIGSQAQINATLANATGVSYTPELNYNGAAQLTVSTNDNGYSGSGSALTDTDNIAITISAVNDAPVNAVPGAQSTGQGVAKVISGISITDVDAGALSLSMSLTATHGTIAVNTAAAGGVPVGNIGGNGSGSITLVGSPAQLNATLANATGVTYTPDANYIGAAQLTVSTNDNGYSGSGNALIDTDIIGINVLAPNQPPVNSVPAAQAATEDTVKVISGISVADPDAGALPLTVTLTQTHGTIAVNTAAAGGVPLAGITGNNSGTLTLIGSQAQINATLANATGVSYTPELNYNGAAQLTVSTNDNGYSGSGSAKTDLDSIAITVAAVNDAPVNTVPLAQTANEDTVKVISGIAVADVDAGALPLTMTLTETHGTIAVNTAAAGGVPIGGITGNGTSTLALTGTLAQINATLANATGVSYTPELNYNGAAQLTFSTSDNGYSGSGNALLDTDSIAITVNAVNDAPVNSVPGAQTTTPGSPKVISGISVADVDAGALPLTMTLTETHGTVAVSTGAVGGVAAGSITGNGSAVVTLTGTVAQINATLAATTGVTYTPEVNFIGTAQLTVSSNDHGYSGSGSALIDTDTIAISVRTSQIDLSVSSLTPTSTTITQGDDFSYAYVVKNIGLDTAAACATGIYIDGQLLPDAPGSNAVGQLAAGQSANESNHFGTAGLSVGPHTLVIRADHGSALAESNEYNNSRHLIFTVAPVQATATQTVALDGSRLVFENTFGFDLVKYVDYYNAIVATENFFQSHFDNDATVRLEFKLEELEESAGAQSSSNAFVLTYENLRHGLTETYFDRETFIPYSDEEGAALTTLLSKADPSQGRGFIVNPALAKMLGLVDANENIDSSITMNSLYFNDEVIAAHSPTFEAATIGTIEHEVSEAMGRTGKLLTNKAIGVSQLPDLNWTEGTSWTYRVPSILFADPDRSRLTYSAALVTGSGDTLVTDDALPAWLVFNPATRTFSGTAPVNSDDLTVRISVTAATGLSAFDDVNLLTPAHAGAADATVHVLTPASAVVPAVPKLGYFGPMDLFRYTAAGVPDYTAGKDGVLTYFSVDGQNIDTSLPFHNPVDSKGVNDGADTADWEHLNGLVKGDAFGGGGEEPGFVSATDLRIMGMLGWTPSQSAPPADDFGNSLTDPTHAMGGFVDKSATGWMNYSGDRDWFLLRVAQAGNATINLKGLAPLDTALANPYLRLHDSTGLLVKETSDITPGHDAQLSYAVLAGDYYVEVGALDESDTGSYALNYSMTVAPADDYGSGPGAPGLVQVAMGGVANGVLEATGDLDWFKVQLVKGTTYAFNLQGLHAQAGTLDDPFLSLFDANGNLLDANDDTIDLQNVDSRLLFKAPANGFYFLEASAALPDSTGSYRLSVAATADDWRDSLTDTVTPGYGQITVGGSATGRLEAASDHDWFAVQLTGGASYAIALQGQHGGGYTLDDPLLRVYSSTGVQLAENDDVAVGVNSDSALTFSAPNTALYYIDAGAFGDASTGTYKLSVAVVSAVVPSELADRFENNDTPQTATDLHTISGTHVESGLSVEADDPDWYRFTLATAGREGDRITLDFQHAQGDLDLYLYNSSGSAELDASQSVGNQESISLAGMAPGTYLVNVIGFEGATNPAYSLGTQVAASTATADRFENNDSAAVPTNLGTLSGTRTESGLSIEANDPDWYRFTLGSAGREGDAITLDFVNSLGDLDLYLYNNAGSTLLGSSTGVGNQETISLAGVAAGSYLVAATGYQGGSNPNYSLAIKATPAGVAADRFENNDTAATATSLGTISGVRTESHLSIEADDPDWYGFTLATAGRPGDQVTLDFLQSLGDLDLYLYNSAGTTVLGTANGVGNQEAISLAGLAAGNYVLRVEGYSHAANPDYGLTLKVAPSVASATDAAFEPNNDSAHATLLRQPGTIQGLAIMPAADVDWFTFTTSQLGRAGNAVSINFTQALGDLDLGLFTAVNGQLVELQSSEGQGDGESISLQGLFAATYFVKVFGYQGAANPAYSLTLNAPIGGAATPAIPGDRFESNNSSQTATDLRTLSGHFSAEHLSIHTSTDQDWFVFRPALSGSVTVGLGFDNSQGDIDLKVFDAAGTGLKGQSDGSTDHESVRFDAQAGVAYRVEAYGYGGATNTDYALTIDAPQAVQLAPDAWEPNNDAQHATQLRDLSHTLQGATITAGDNDWFAFHMAATGRAGDNVTLNYAGDTLQLSLLNASSVPLGAQAVSSQAGNVSVSLQGLAAGDYLAHVAGSSGTSVASYSLSVSAPPVAATPDTWTILVYIAGDNNLEGAGLTDINEMESVILPAGVHVVVQMDRTPRDEAFSKPGYTARNGDWDDTRRGAIVHDDKPGSVSSPLVSIGETNTSDPNVLKDFINWGATNFPAQHYGLIIWDHGGGILAGSAQDETSGNALLSVKAASQAITQSSLTRVDLFGYDACLMANIDVAAAAKAYANVMIASEMPEPGSGWDYNAFLSQFVANPASTATQLAAAIVDGYGAWPGNDVQTLAAIDLGKVDALEAAINSFVDTMEHSATATDWNKVALAVRASWQVDKDLPYSYDVDLGDFMARLEAQTANAAIDTAAQGVIEALQASILRKAGRADATGLTVILPDDGAVSARWHYDANHVDFLRQSRWDDFLNLFVQSQVGVVRSAAASGLGESTDTSGRAIHASNDLLIQALDLGTVGTPNYQVAGIAIDNATDIDWYHFQLAQAPPANAAIQVAFNATAGSLKVGLYDAEQARIGSETSGNLSLAGLQAGTDYFLKVEGTGQTVTLDYSIAINATGGVAPAVVPRDFAEANGGNDSLSKAWTLGRATELVDRGTIANLTFDATDSATGGDWFRVASVRQTELNANRVSISNVGPLQGNLKLSVFDSAGQLIGSADTNNNSESVTFDQRGEDIFVQVSAAPGHQNAGYSLSVSIDRAPSDPGVNVALQAYSWRNHTLLGGVTLDGSHNTASNGTYNAVGVTDPALDLTPLLSAPPGGLAATSSAVNLQDAIAILKMVVGLEVNGAGKALSAYQAIAADFDGNGAVGLSDAIGVLRHVVGLSAPDASWVFVNEADASMPARAALTPGTLPGTVTAEAASHVGLVGVLRGDVDGSWAAPAGSQSLDNSYFASLVAGLNTAHPETSFNVSQWGIYA